MLREFVAAHRAPKCLGTDNGGENLSNVFRTFCRESQVKQGFTVLKTPQHNDVAVRYNRLIKETTRYLLAE